jgi:hypothetical protein
MAEQLRASSKSCVMGRIVEEAHERIGIIDASKTTAHRCSGGW